jgi:hypothetical protein
MPRAKSSAATKKSAKTPKKAVLLSQVEIAICHELLGGDKTSAQIAGALGLSLQDVTAIRARKHVQTYMAEYQAIFMNKMADAEARKLLKMNITRDTIAERLYLLSLTPPAETKGSIDGQVTALKELSDLLGLKFDANKLPEALRGMSDEQLRNYAGMPQ